jgi:hypothetical protein
MENIRILKRIRVVLLVISLTCLGCSKKSNEHYLFSDERSDIHYKVVYKNDTILYIKYLIDKNNQKVDTTIFIKKRNGYYEFVDDPFSDFKQRLRLSVKQDTLYNYGVLGALFYCKIKKLPNSRFKTTFAKKDSLEYTYRHSIYYDKQYNIYKIETIEDHKKDVFKVE